ncbi:hypothetical protein CYY_003722 [Polysphondylium violaceum]|uniref:Glucosidase 2 subunit beta n=1 Tax=Polysphondylium violaceum TaxID=133409 RepID=A0A8J4V0X2_9MYCE|nr:hypothetical protein CYY_003722 [Polysphondylium violaceum]
MMMRLNILIVSSLLFLIIGLSYSKPLSKDYGVSPEEIEFYKGEKFNCLRSNKQVPISQVNDDYCDCPDGTDEPGTSACSNGHFYCINKGHKGQFIASSFVNDGVCDCCDGSDEYSSMMKCKNTCNELGKEMREKQLQDQEKYAQGLKKKAEMIKDAIEVMESKTASLEKLRKEIEPINQEIKELEVLKENKDKEKQQELDKIKEKEEEFKAKTTLETTNEEKQQQDIPDNDVVKEIEKELKENEEKEQLTSEVYDEILKGIEQLEKEIQTKRDSLRDKQNEIQKIEEMLKMDFGKNNVFLALYGKCFDLKTKEYTYTLCPFDRANQGGTSLGKFEKWENDYENMLFTNGQQCWGGPKRSIKVSLECGSENEAYDVQEPGKCEYTIKLKTPASCDEEHLKVLLLENDHSF